MLKLTCSLRFYRLQGQILVNKLGNNGMNFAALRVAMHMQLEHEFYFSLSGGDKDTFVSATSFWSPLPLNVYGVCFE